MDIDEEIKIYMNVEFTVNDPIYPYADIITIEESEFENITYEDIRAMQEQRYNEWLKVVKAGE
jgi:hypothetical protein